eukprot:TRINITY_DN42160_c0_g1_i1.p2 TRINITY_DN42160_c0_g1~~TRINITY_DN42160_c0_g1_i1.p2  ORF type:complete len:131 (+),score=17.53 TRINITY_DN42160_c0_g1_i1:75-467(+)
MIPTPLLISSRISDLPSAVKEEPLVEESCDVGVGIRKGRSSKIPRRGTPTSKMLQVICGNVCDALVDVCEKSDVLADLCMIRQHKAKHELARAQRVAERLLVVPPTKPFEKMDTIQEDPLSPRRFSIGGT